MKEMENEGFREKSQSGLIEVRRVRDDLGKSKVLVVLLWHNQVFAVVAYEVVQMLSSPIRQEPSVRHTLRKYRSKKCKYSRIFFVKPGECSSSASMKVHHHHQEKPQSLFISYLNKIFQKLKKN